jgi:hypothetical protein
MAIRKALLVVAFPALLATPSASPSGPALAPESAGPSEFDPLPTLDAADFLPPALLKGPNHEVDRKVTSDGVSNFYSVRTKYGDFQTAGTSLVAVRVGEVNAIAELKSLDKVAVGAQGVVGSVVDSGKGALQIVTHPVEAVTGLAGGVARLFGRIGRAVQRTSEEADQTPGGQPKSTGQKVAETSGGLTEELVGVNYTTRVWARRLNVDPYTPNPMLRDELRSVARYDAGGRFLLKVAPIGLAGTLLGGATAVNDLVFEKEPDELQTLNEKRLAAMGATAEQSRAFRLNRQYGITRQTDFVASLDTLTGVTGRGELVERASLAANDAEAQFFADSARLMREFHLRESPLDAIVTDRTGPCASSGRRRFACFFPLDYVVWTESVAGNIRDLTDRVRSDFPAATREMWITGRVSPRTARELYDCGWTVYELTALTKASASEAGR